MRDDLTVRPPVAAAVEYFSLRPGRAGLLPLPTRQTVPGLVRLTVHGIAEWLRLIFSEPRLHFREFFVCKRTIFFTEDF